MTTNATQPARIVRVLFRVDTRKGINPDKEVTAVLPDMEANAGRLACYAHVGQHGECTRDWYRTSTRPAKPAEFHPLLAELRCIYEPDARLRVVSKLGKRHVLPDGHNVVAVPMGAAAVRPGKRGESDVGYLTHACEIDANGSLVRVLCKRVQTRYLLEDSSLYNDGPVTCGECASRVKAYTCEPYDGRTLTVQP